MFYIKQHKLYPTHSVLNTAHAAIMIDWSACHIQQFKPLYRIYYASYVYAFS